MLARKALAGTAAAPKVYVEDVFSTYLYTGTGSSQTITNNIDISGEGGLVWIKGRTEATNHLLADTVNGTTKHLQTSTTGAAFDGSSSYITGFSSTGFSVGSSIGIGTNGQTYASWTFRKAKKFFDVVTWTGDGNAKTINHNLGSTPGCIIIKATNDTSSWGVYHRSVSGYGLLNSTNAWSTPSIVTAANSTTFSIIAGWNDPSVTYVAYLFAHDAGGFGDAGSDNVISCGSVTANGSGAVAETNLGWEPQWVLYKRTDSTSNWFLFDTMRGLVTGTDPTSTNNKALYPNLSDAEINSGSLFQPLATGFAAETAAANSTWIYIAIRRGPMKTPTTGTSVFAPTTYTGNGTSQTITSPGFTPDMLIGRVKASSTASVVDKLRGSLNYLYTSNSDGEVGSNSTSDVTAFTNTGFNVGADNRGNWNTSSGSEIVWTLKRAPGFFDVVAYAGTGSARTVTHNLGVTPELMLVKNRSEVYDWRVYSAETGGTKYLVLNSTAAAVTSSGAWNDTAPTSSVFTVGDSLATNKSGNNIVAYLFASLAGVSKIGTVTVASSAINVDCGFTSSARFVLLKRTSGASGWIVFDSARGIVAGDDPYLYLNSSAAENSDGASDIIDTYSSGFTLPAGGLSGITGEGTYLYLAIA